MLCIDEVVNINNLPPPQKRPALSIAPEYRGLRLSDMEGGGKEEEKESQETILSKIANLRKAINEVRKKILKVWRRKNHRRLSSPRFPT